MKKLATLLIAAGLVLWGGDRAQAIDFKVKGDWWVVFDYGQHGNFQKNQGNGKNGYNGKEDEFNAAQRFRIQIEAVASEYLSGTVFFELGGQTWGKNTDGAALGADGKVVKVKRAYLDWRIPETYTKVRMGIMGFLGPSYATEYNQFFSDDVAGMIVYSKFSLGTGLAAFWMRPYNDNYAGYKAADGTIVNANYMDHFDIFGLAAPLHFDGFKFTPFGAIAVIGPNSFRDGDTRSANTLAAFQEGKSMGDNVAKQSLQSGMLPAWGVHYAGKGMKLTDYATAIGAGFAAEITAADPFRFAIDFIYGTIQCDQENLRTGWLVAALGEYKTDWGIPGIIGWYSSGDDDNPDNGSERLPFLSLNQGTNTFSNFAFDGSKEFTRDSVVGSSMSGLWGVGLRLRDVSFLENLKHTFRLTYMGGTNSPDLLKKIARGVQNKIYSCRGSYGTPGTGVENLYLTTDDSLVEIGLRNEYKMYENFKIILDFDYVFLNLASSTKKNLKGMGVFPSRETADAWNVQLGFAYQF